MRSMLGARFTAAVGFELSEDRRHRLTLAGPRFFEPGPIGAFNTIGRSGHLL